MIRRQSLLFLFTLCLAGYLAAVMAIETGSGGDEVHFSGNRVSINVKNATLQELIQKVAERYPLELRLYGSMENGRRDWRFRDKPLVDLLRQLLRDHSVVMFFRSGEAEKSKLTRLDIYASNAKTFDRPVAPEEAPETPAASLAMNPPPQEAGEAHRDGSQLDGVQDDLSVESLGHNLENSESEQARLQALRLLDQLDTDLARQQIMAALGDRADRVRLAVVTVLSKWQNEDALNALGQVVFGDNSAEVRVAALKGLARYDNEYRPAARAFLESALGDRDETVAAAALSLMNSTAEP